MGRFLKRITKKEKWLEERERMGGIKSEEIDVGNLSKEDKKAIVEMQKK